MQSKKKIRRIMNKVYMTIGKTVVFTGAFSLMFYLLGNLFRFIEPYLTKVSHIVVANMQWLVIGTFVITILINGVLRLVSKIVEKRQLAGIEFEGLPK